MGKARKFKKNKPQIGARSSMSPAVFWTADTVRKINNLIPYWQERAEIGMGLVCLEAAGLIAEAVKQGAPVLPGGVDYAKDLRVALVNGGEGPTVAIYYENKERKENSDLVGDNGTPTALYFRAKQGAPKWVFVLEKNNPWPANLIPEKPTEEQALVIARKITGSEEDSLSDRIKRIAPAIENALSDGGLENPKIRFDTNASEGLEVLDDIGYSVLRSEFGYGGKQTSHWRPAIKKMMDSLQQLGEKFVKYVETGKSGIFNIPDHGEIGVGQLAAYGPEFQEKITAAIGIR